MRRKDAGEDQRSAMMTNDFSQESKGLKFFLTSVIICLVGMVLWLAVAQPMTLSYHAPQEEHSGH